MTGPQQYGNGLGPLEDMFLFAAAIIGLWSVIGVILIIGMWIADACRGRK